jgi:hypothetical protein
MVSWSQSTFKSSADEDCCKSYLAVLHARRGGHFGIYQRHHLQIFFFLLIFCSLPFISKQFKRRAEGANFCHASESRWIIICIILISTFNLNFRSISLPDEYEITDELIFPGTLWYSYIYISNTFEPLFLYIVFTLMLSKFNI